MLGEWNEEESIDGNAQTSEACESLISSKAKRAAHPHTASKIASCLEGN